MLVRVNKAVGLTYEMNAIALVLLFVRSFKTRKKRKKYSIHPLLQTRHESDQFAICFQLKKHEDKLFGYVRMRIGPFEVLLQKLYETIKGQNTKFGKCIKPEEKLVIALRYVKYNKYPLYLS